MIAPAIVVHHADPGDARHVREVTAAWRTARADLASLGLNLPSVTLRAAKSANDFARLTGEAWFVAAVTKHSVVYTQRLAALSASKLLPFTIRHELFHVAQPRHLPRWLAEGLARIFSGEARNDPNGATGLEAVSNGELDRLLAAREERAVRAAYREATRRAARELRTKGWRGVLARTRS